MNKKITKFKFYLSVFFVVVGIGCLLFLKSDESKFMGIPSNKFMWGVVALINLLPVYLYLKQEKSDLNQ